jgi:dihydrofolate reductase
MTAVTCGVTISTDGYVAGPNQSLESPLGDGGERLHRWQFEQVDRNQAEIQGLTSAGAYVMGRNMFGPGRGEWDLAWNGWWGEDPPYHAPVFVLTHHVREPVTMAGGTTFTFVTEGIEAALERAKAAAGGRHVAIAGGAATINQYLAAGLIDELWLHVAPFTLGAGARLFEGVGPLTLEPLEVGGTDLVSHIRYRVPH